MSRDPHNIPTNRLGTLEATAKKPGGSHASLVVFHGEASRVVRLVEGAPVVVGRDPTAEISISDDSISRRHASFSVAAGVVTVTDLGSTNGTKLNGTAVDSAVMNPGDEATVGRVTVSLHVLGPSPSARLGLATHDQFLSALDHEAERAKAFGRGFTVVMLRHPRVEALAAALRPVDTLARYADRTLELLLPEADAAAARATVEKLGATEAGFATWPSDGTSAEALLELSREALQRGGNEQPVVQPKSAPAMVATSAAMQTVLATVKRVASSVLPVLIHGETGSGKELLARAIHEQSPRAGRRLVSINCGAIPQTLVESVLFGHERGAFTGAVASSRGVFEEADGSTVLLDEIGELPAAAQAALLRVLETKEVRRVGSTRDVTVDVRIVAATHRDLEAMVKAGTFREDLLYRLNAVTLELPPLRERPEEICPLAERFIALANAANGRKVKGLDADAMRLLLRYPWPGNIRELRNAVEHAVVVAQGPVVQPADLPRRVHGLAAVVLQTGDGEPATPLTTNNTTNNTSTDLRESVQRYETQVILEALRAAAGNRTEAARRLQIPVRTLSHKIQQLGIKKLGFGTDDE